jgi:DNA-binding response OmpR family regulator
MFRKDVLFYAEDDSGLFDLLNCAVSQGQFNVRVVHVPDGEQAIRYFKGEGEYADRERFPLPGAALVDLKMPRVSGFELIRWLRASDNFKQLPIVVLTVSEELRDVNRAYQMGANSFLIKPPTVKDLRETLDLVESYWLGLNVPPSGAEEPRRP